MDKIKLRKAFAKLSSGSIYVYYYYQKEMKFPTGVSISTDKDRYKKYLEWDEGTRMIKIPTKYNGNIGMIDVYQDKIKRVQELVNRANSYIRDYFNKNINIHPDELEQLLIDKHENIVTVANKTFMGYYQDFLIKKKRHFEVKTGKPISIKDYNSTYNLLLAFQAYKKKLIRVDDMNLFWLEDIHEFCKLKHPAFYGTTKVIIKGNMNNNTLKKRLAVIAEFYDYLKELEVSTHSKVEMIRSYRKKIDTEKKHKETLTIKEIHQVYKKKFKHRWHEEIRDLFIFLCLTGIRFQDLVEFDKQFIRKATLGSGTVYIKNASKTSLAYNIPICRIANEILKKYNYDLPKVTNQHGNRMIKEVLEMTKLFNDVTELKNKETGEYLKRFDAITLHKGRNTFITNLVDKVPLNQLMKMTGHKKISTLQSYIDNTRPVDTKYIKIFD